MLTYQNELYVVQQMEEKEMKRFSRSMYKELQAVFNSITDPVIILNTNLEVIEANIATMEKLKLEQSEVLKRKCYNLFGDHKESSCEDCPSRRALQTGLPTRDKMYDLLNERLYEVNAYPIFDESDSEIKTIIEFRRDITKAAEMEGRIMKAENWNGKSNFAAEVGHELKNMFTVIKGHMNLMQIYLEQEDLLKMKKSLDSTNEGMKKVITYANELMENQFQEKNVVEIKLVPFLNALINFIKPQKLFSSVQFNRDWRNREVIIKANEIKLQQIFINLFKNAAEAMKEGSISVSTELIEDNKTIQIKVFDDGSGIPCEILDHIFHVQFTTKEYGHGYGLAIVRKLIEQNKGTIHVKSKLNYGTEFTIKFPAILK